MRELLPWAACRKRPGPVVPPFDWGTIAQVAAAEAKQVQRGVVQAGQRPRGRPKWA